MPTKLSTTVDKIEKVPNKSNSELIKKFHQFMISNGICFHNVYHLGQDATTKVFQVDAR
jgi:hypothetical protein